jgi:glycosyltransferase involved in cell wall biosynthesis
MSDSTRGPIAFFLPSVRGGGAQRVFINLAQGMIERGLPLDFVLAAAEGVFLDDLPASVRVVDLRARRLLRSIGPLIEYLRRERPRVLISGISHANLVALWAVRLAGVNTPLIVTVHNTMSQSTPQRGRLAGGIWRRLFRTFYPWASSIVAVSRGAAEDLARSSGLPLERVEVLYNPVITPALMAQARKSPDHPWLTPGQPPVVIGVGRLTPQKDFATLIRAFAEVRRRRVARLLILGEGEERSRLEALATELGVSDDVTLPGFRDNAMAYMAASRVFALSSAWEGLPTVLIEALAAGAGVVSTDCPSGPREILQDGRLGTLVPVANPPALAGAIIDALDRPAPAAPLEALAPFTLNMAVENYLRVIESACRERGATLTGAGDRGSLGAAVRP